MNHLLYVVLILIIVILIIVIYKRSSFVRNVSGGIIVNTKNVFDICDSLSMLNGILSSSMLLQKSLNEFNTYRFDGDVMNLARNMCLRTTDDNPAFTVKPIDSSFDNQKAIEEISRRYMNVSVVLSFYVFRVNKDRTYMTAYAKKDERVSTAEYALQHMLLIHHALRIEHREYSSEVSEADFYKKHLKYLIAVVKNKGTYDGDLQRIIDYRVDDRFKYVLKYDNIYDNNILNKTHFDATINLNTITYTSSIYIRSTMHAMLYDVLKQTLIDDIRHYNTGWENLKNTLNHCLHIRGIQPGDENVFMGIEYNDMLSGDLAGVVYIASLLHYCGFRIHNSGEVLEPKIPYTKINPKDRMIRAAFLNLNILHYREMYTYVDDSKFYAKAMQDKILKRYQQCNAALYDLAYGNPEIPIKYNIFSWNEEEVPDNLPLTEYEKWLIKNVKTLDMQHQVEYPNFCYFDPDVANFLHVDLTDYEVPTKFVNFGNIPDDARHYKVEPPKPRRIAYVPFTT